MPSSRFPKWLWIVLTVIVLAGMVILAGTILARRTLPQISGTLRLPGLHAPVTAARDRWGVPHIYASDQHDLFMAQGYVTAQDRLWQMLLRRQAVQGRLDAWLGADVAQADDVLGRQDFPAQAEEMLDAVEPGIRAALDAYVLGINACLQSSPTPPELMLLQRQGKAARIEPWTDKDSIALSQLLLWIQGQQSDAGLPYALAQKLGAERLAVLWPEGITPGHLSLPVAPELRQVTRYIGLPLWRDESLNVASAPGLPAALYVMAMYSDGPVVWGGTWPGVPGMMVDQTVVISDSLSISAVQDTQVLVKHLLDLPPDGWLQVRVHGMLRQWDNDLFGKTRLGNASAAVYQVWVWHLARDTFRDELGPDLFARYWATGLDLQALARLADKPDDPWWDDVTTPQRENRDDIFRRAYAETLDYLGRHYGDLHTIWEWDSMHAAQLGHPLGEIGWISAWLNRTVKLGGDAPFDPARSDDPQTAYTPVLIQSLRINQDKFSLAGGQSGNPLSPHYADLLPLWARGEYAPLQDAGHSQDLKDVEGVLVLTP